jgi:hypothetical protein
VKRELYDHENECRDPTQPLAEGWQFWYPILLCVARANPTIRDTANFLFSIVQPVDLYTDGMFLRFHTASVSLRDDNEQWAGILRPHCEEYFPQTRRFKKEVIRLIAVSLGRAKNSNPGKRLEEWDRTRSERDLGKSECGEIRCGPRIVSSSIPILNS